MAGSQVAPIDNLPSELLNLIFEFIHDDLKSSPSEKNFEHGLTLSERDLDDFEDDEEEEDHDLDFDDTDFLTSQQNLVFTSFLPTLFPYCIASVSPRWEAILSSSPAFWTRVVLPISHATNLKKFGQYLAWSQNLPIDIFILRDYSEDYGQLREKDLVYSFLSFLRPHMRRCRSLHLELKFNSSLPSLSKIVPDDSPLLRALYTHCSFDVPESEPEEEEEEEEEDIDDDEAYPRLQFMKLDGRTFSRALEEPPYWFIPQPQLRHLEIGPFNAPSTGLPLTDTVRMISRLCKHSLASLCLSGIKLAYKYRYVIRVPSSLYHFDRVQSLYLGEMDSADIEEFLDLAIFPNLVTLNLRDCAGVRPRIFDQIPSIVGMLALDQFSRTKNMRDLSAKANPHVDMIRLLSNWHGIILSLSTSDAPFDTIFAAFAEPSPARHNLFPGESDLLCPNMQNLLISACPSPSFDIVKKMIEIRNKRVDYHDPFWRHKDHEAPVIMKLEFKFCWPMWTSEQMDWMRAKVPDFQWLKS